MEKLIIETNEAPMALGPYSQGVMVGSWFFISGQLGIDPESGRLLEGGAAAQAERALLNAEAVLRSAGGTLDDAVRVVLYLKNLSDFAEVNSVFQRYFVERPPTRSTVAVADLPLEALVEIEIQAYLAN